jgi:hypothetical protein
LKSVTASSPEGVYGQLFGDFSQAGRHTEVHFTDTNGGAVSSASTAAIA